MDASISDQSSPAMDSADNVAELSDSEPVGPAWDSLVQSVLLQGLLAMMSVLLHILDYLLSPRVLLTHAIAWGLFFALTRQGCDWRPVVRTTILQEVVTYVIWLIAPGDLGTIVAIYFSLYLYELLLGPKVKTRTNATFITEDDLTSALHELGPALTYSVEQKDQQFWISTSLDYLVYARGSTSHELEKVIPLADISTVNKGYDLDLSRAVRAEKATSSTCFYITLDGQQTTVTFISRDQKSRDLWVTAFQELCCSQIGDVKLLWLEKACKAVGISATSNGCTQQDQLDRVLKAAQRDTDKAYLTELYKAQTKAAAKNHDNNNGKDAAGLDKIFDVITFKPEIEIVYERTLKKTSTNNSVLKAQTLWQFLRTEQHEVDSDIACVRTLMKDHETVLPSLYMTSVGFTNYMMSDYNSIFNHRHRRVYQDMRQPLSHYFINTSHNTYLTKDQLKSKSSVEMYISALKRGCKCVELDTWDGPNSEPIIYHGRTLTSKILFRDVITAVRDYAFVVSPYPVILSFENHCSVDQQRVLASHLINILGDKLYTAPMPDDETQYPSPDDLQGYVIVKYKKLTTGAGESIDEIYDDWSDEDISDDDLKDAETQFKDADKYADFHHLGDDEIETASLSSLDFDEESIKKKSGSMLSLLDVMKGIKTKRGSTKSKSETPKIAQELSDLVIYCRSVRFKGFEYAKERNAFSEMSSLGEKKAVKLAKEDPCGFVEYNCRQLTRVYPGGGRVDSSNYDPVTLWNVGCQMVALNFQTPDRSMQLNQGLFLDNGGCGYVLKPGDLRRDNQGFDPRGPFTNYTKLKLQIISGQQLPYSSEKHVKSERALQVHIRVCGVDADCTKDKTKVVKNNGYHVIWNEVLTFKLYEPSLALVQFVVRDGDSFLGQFTLPVTSMQQGYRNVPLLSKASNLLPQALLFVHVEKSS